MAEKLNEASRRLLAIMRDLLENGREGFLLHEEPISIEAIPPRHRPIGRESPENEPTASLKEMESSWHEIVKYPPMPNDKKRIDHSLEPPELAALPRRHWLEEETPYLFEMEDHYEDMWAEGKRGAAAPIKVADVEKVFYPGLRREEDLVVAERLRQEAVRICFGDQPEVMLRAECGPNFDDLIESALRARAIKKTIVSGPMKCRCFLAPDQPRNADFDDCIYWAPDGRVIDTRATGGEQEEAIRARRVFSLTTRGLRLAPQREETAGGPSDKKPWRRYRKHFIEFLERAHRMDGPGVMIKKFIKAIVEDDFGGLRASYQPLDAPSRQRLDYALKKQWAKRKR